MMDKARQCLSWTGLGVLLLFLLGSCSRQSREPAPKEHATASPTPEDRPGDCPVARVGGRYIYYSDLVRASRAEENTIPVSDLSREQEIFNIRYKLLDQLLVRETLRQEAEEMGIEVTDEEVENWLQQMGAWGNSDVLANYYPWLQGLSPEEFKAELKVDMEVFQAVQRRIGEIHPVTENEVRSFYEENRDKLRTPIQVSAFVILIKKEGRTREEALQKIKDVRANLAGDLGEADSWEERTRIFADYARLYSEHDASDMGGHWLVSGTGSEEGERAEFLQLAFEVPLRSLSEVQEISSGFVVTMVESRSASELPPYELAKDKLRRLLILKRNENAQPEVFLALKEKYRPAAFPENILGCGAGMP